jgi:hypothetical protein
MTITDQFATVEESRKSPFPAEVIVLHRSVTVHFTPAELLKRWARNFSGKYYIHTLAPLDPVWMMELNHRYSYRGYSIYLTTLHIFNLVNPEDIRFVLF